VAIWGPTAKDFDPDRWFTKDGIPKGAQEFSGYHHSLTFFDGPRTCLGKYVAISEMKVCSSTSNARLSNIFLTIYFFTGYSGRALRTYPELQNSTQRWPRYQIFNGKTYCASSCRFWRRESSADAGD
jgi:hypothetical protein